ncbi:hypothetical protein NX059_011330 [Plenodomus lindquistii]|nr:hypothetical protein NX059_011330 [Plenodomus lindquistii]
MSNSDVFSAQEPKKLFNSTALERARARNSSSLSSLETAPAKTQHDLVSTPQSQKSSYFSPKSASTVVSSRSSRNSTTKSEHRLANSRRQSRSSLLSSPYDDEWMEAGTPEAVNSDPKAESATPPVVSSAMATLRDQLFRNTPAGASSQARKTSWAGRFFGSRSTTLDKTSNTSAITKPEERFAFGGEERTRPVEIAHDGIDLVKSRSSFMAPESDVAQLGKATKIEEAEDDSGDVLDDDTIFHLPESSSSMGTPPSLEHQASAPHKQSYFIGTASLSNINQLSAEHTHSIADVHTSEDISNLPFASSIRNSLSSSTSGFEPNVPVPPQEVPTLSAAALKTTSDLADSKDGNVKSVDGPELISYRKHLKPSTIRRLAKRRADRLPKQTVSTEGSHGTSGLPVVDFEPRGVLEAPKAVMTMIEPFTMFSQTPEAAPEVPVTLGKGTVTRPRPARPTAMFTMMAPVTIFSQPPVAFPEALNAMNGQSDSPELLAQTLSRHGMSSSQICAIVLGCICVVAVHATLANVGESVDTFELAHDMSVAFVVGLGLAIVGSFFDLGVVTDIAKQIFAAFRDALGSVFDTMVEWTGRYERQ